MKIAKLKVQLSQVENTAVSKKKSQAQTGQKLNTVSLNAFFGFSFLIFSFTAQVNDSKCINHSTAQRES